MRLSGATNPLPPRVQAIRVLAPIITTALAALTVEPAAAQSPEPPPVLKVHNYLPHMTRPEG